MPANIDASTKPQEPPAHEPQWYRWVSTTGALGFAMSAVATSTLSHDTAELLVGRIAAAYVTLAVVSGVVIWALHGILRGGRPSHSGSWYVTAGMLCPIIGSVIVYGAIPLLTMEAPAVLGAVAMPCLGLAVGGELAQLVRRRLRAARLRRRGQA
ncbi:DUF4149 domain-containing protein [Amycolatopsis rubida]|uniref:Uncharacterized protein n=1 Tax=Amycolatopsis rubida TaxID=112413 RepID=A0A1I5X553_9PSEU|nr:DUF4149 domain-containing protein [Amycolatopsis rubida]SFQ27001.1 hypothetical protein SAMN05421854_11034 [Amycolatopsis rubida]